MARFSFKTSDLRDRLKTDLANLNPFLEPAVKIIRTDYPPLVISAFLRAISNTQFALSSIENRNSLTYTNTSFLGYF